MSELADRLEIVRGYLALNNKNDAAEIIDEAIAAIDAARKGQT